MFDITNSLAVKKNCFSNLMQMLVMITTLLGILLSINPLNPPINPVR